jgi:hypothetical protein
MPNDGSDSDFRRVLYGILWWRRSRNGRTSWKEQRTAASKEKGELLRLVEGCSQSVVAARMLGSTIGPIGMQEDAGYRTKRCR